MELEPWDFRDPGAVVGEVAARHHLRAGDLRLALVRDPSGEQRVQRVRTISRAARRGIDQRGMSDLLADTVIRLGAPEWRRQGPRHAVLTVTARRGYAVIGRHEAPLLVAWRYAHHLRSVFTGDLVVVTEHGWHDGMSGLGGVYPHLDESG